MSLGKGLVVKQLVGPALVMARGDWPLTLYKLMKNLLCLEVGQWFLVQLLSDEEDELAKQDPTLDHCSRGEDN